MSGRLSLLKRLAAEHDVTLDDDVVTFIASRVSETDGYALEHVVLRVVAYAVVKRLAVTHGLAEKVLREYACLSGGSK